MIALETARSRWLGAAIALLVVTSAGATSVPRISFEELTDKSETIASGQITRSWSDWDSAHQHIWTHYELTVSATYKGAAAQSVTISEPGGVVGGIGMSVAGTVTYAPGDKVLVFLERMPNGYLRTTGWGQGQYRIDASGLVHASESLKAVDLVTGSAPTITSLDGMRVGDLTNRVKARVRAKGIQ
jgi:hypothetical protein